MSHTLHQLRCQGIRSDKKKEVRNAGRRTQEAEENVSNHQLNLDEKEGNIGTNLVTLETPGTTEQWECRFCTFLNDYCQIEEVGSDVMMYCSMCQNAQLIDNIGGETDETSNDSLKADDESESEESITADLSTWSCTYCTVVNHSCDEFCRMCEMPSVSLSPSHNQEYRRNRDSLRPISSSFLQAVPAVCGIFGLTIGALLTNSSRQESSNTVRNGVMSSMLLGALAGMAISVLGDRENEEAQSSNESYTDATRLPIHRYQCDTISSEAVGMLREKSPEHDRVSCRICMEDYQAGEEIKTLKCFHMFHSKCVDEWLSRKTTCPLCCTPL